MVKKRKELRYVVGEGSAAFLDLNVDTSLVEIMVNGPGMGISGLQLVTSLSFPDGYCSKSLRRFCDELNVTSHCGHVGVEDVTSKIISPHQIPILEFGVGSTGMYLNRLFFETRRGITFQTLLKKYLSPNSRKQFFAGLIPIQQVHRPHNHMTNGQGSLLAHHSH